MTRAQTRFRAVATGWALFAILGLVGTVLLAVSSYRTGALIVPRHLKFYAINKRAVARQPARVLYFAGLTALCVAWLGIGRFVAARRMPWRLVRRIGWAWAVPLLAAMPLGSRDVWAYLGQSEVAAQDANPYSVSPIQAHVRSLGQVDPVWRHATSPYGPVWTWAGRAVLAVDGNNLHAVVLLFRLLCAIGLLLMSLALPRLCRVAGGDPATGLWLVCASPFTLVVCLAGGHNDLLMVGLVALALWAAVTAAPPWLSLGGATLACATAADIKIPALVASVFLPAVWLTYSPAAAVWRRRRFAFLEVSAAVALGTIAFLLTVGTASGYGLGWLQRLNAAESGITWLSLPVGLHAVSAFVRGGTVAVSETSTGYRAHTQTAHTTTIALLIVAATLVALWLRSRNHPPMPLLAIGMLVAVVSSVAVQPWYGSWPLLVVGALALTDVAVAALAAVGIAMTVTMQTFGGNELGTPLGLSLALLAVLLTWAMTRKPLPRALRTLLTPGGRRLPGMP